MIGSSNLTLTVLGHVTQGENLAEDLENRD